MIFKYFLISYKAKISFKMEVNQMQKAQGYIEHFMARMWKYYNSMQQCYIFHGLTKACKSTLVTLRSGTICESYKNKIGDIKIRIKKLDKEGFDPIGHQIQSCTIVPNFVNDCLDLPGVGDSRSLVIALINAYMKYICLKASKKFKFVIAVHESGLAQPGTDFIKTIKTFFQNFPKLKQNMDKIVSATVLVISKGQKQIQDITKIIERFSQLNLVQMKGHNQQYKIFLTKLIEQNRILLFKKPESAGKIIINDLNKQIDSKTNAIAFQEGQIGSAIAVDIKESLSKPNMKKEFDQYLSHLECTILGTIHQGLDILNQLVVNAFNNPNDFFVDQEQNAQKQSNFKERILNYVDKNEKSLMNKEIIDYLIRHNMLRDLFLLEKIQDKKDINNFRQNKNKNTEETVISNCVQHLTCQNLKIIIQSASQSLQNGLTIYQQTNKLKQKVLAVMGRLTKLASKENMMTFFRFCYALKNKIEWVMAGMLMLSTSKDQEITSQFSKIMLNTEIKDAFEQLNNKMTYAVQKKLDNYSIISHQSTLSLPEILIRYYTIQIKPNQKSDSHYLIFNSELLDKLLLKVRQYQSSQQKAQGPLEIPKSQWAQWERNLIKKRKAQILRILANKSSEEGKLRSAAYYAAESIQCCQEIEDQEARKIAIKSRSLLAKTIETAIKEYYKKAQKKTANLKSTTKTQQAMIQSKVLEDAIQQNKINFEDCLEIYKANNQTNQELRILEEEYNKNRNQKLGIRLMNRLFDCLRRQKALQIAQTVYEAAGDNLENKKHINKLILANLDKTEEKIRKLKDNIQQREQYKCIPSRILCKFHFNMKKQASDSSSTD